MEGRNKLWHIRHRDFARNDGTNRPANGQTCARKNERLSPKAGNFGAEDFFAKAASILADAR